MRRKGVMTHFVGILVVCVLHRRRSVFRLPGFWGSHGVTTLSSLWVHGAAARVLPHAARAAPTARWDVLLVGVCSAGRSSALRRKKKTERKWDICLSSRSLCCTLWSLSAWLWVKCFRKLNAKVILIAHWHVLFSFSANSIYCPRSYWHFLPSLDWCTPLIHLSDPSTSPSTRISFLLRWLQLLWPSYVSVDKLKPYECLLLPKAPTGSSSIAVRHWGQALVMNVILMCIYCTVIL